MTHRAAVLRQSKYTVKNEKMNSSLEIGYENDQGQKSGQYKQLHLTPDMTYTATILIAVPTNNLRTEEKQKC